MLTMYSADWSNILAAWLLISVAVSAVLLGPETSLGGVFLVVYHNKDKKTT